MRGLSLLVITYESIESRFRAKMKQETYLESRNAQVGEQLTTGCGRQLSGGLDLEDHLVVDHHVEALPADRFALVADANPYLPRDIMATADELALQCRSVDRFEQPEPELVGNLVKRAYDRSRKCLVEKIGPEHS